MYWKNQETIVFHLVSFLVFIIHFCSINIFFVVSDIPWPYALLIVVFNILIFSGLVPYAKWLWKTNFVKSFYRIIKIYFVLLIFTAVFFIICLKSLGKF
jgi:hypothetical protein